MTHGEWVCSTPRCCGKSGWMTEAMLKRGEVLLMTGKGITPDELQMRLLAVFGKEDVTVDEFLERAKELGVTASELAAIIEDEREMVRILLNDRRPLKTE